MVIDDIIMQKPIQKTAIQGSSMLGHKLFLAGRRRVPTSLALSVIAIAAGAFTTFSWNTSQLKFSSVQNSVIVPSTSKAKELKQESLNNDTNIPISVKTFTFISNSVSEKTKTSAFINWETNQSATGIVHYGTSSNNLTLSAPAPKLATIQSVTLSNLLAKTTYYYQIEATSENGSMTSTTISSFVTKP